MKLTKEEEQWILRVRREDAKELTRYLKLLDMVKKFLPDAVLIERSEADQPAVKSKDGVFVFHANAYHKPSKYMCVAIAGQVWTEGRTPLEAYRKAVKHVTQEYEKYRKVMDAIEKV